MIFKKVVLGLILSLLTSVSFAAGIEQGIEKKLKEMLPNVSIKQIQKSPVDGFYQIQLDNSKIFYVSSDGKYLIQGYLFDLSGQEPKNLTLEAEEKLVGNMINGLDKSKMVIFQAKDNKPVTHVTIFTDTTCPYCHKLHANVPLLNQQGIEVRYLAFPREGLASKGFEELQKVWCADNKQEAMNQFMQGSAIQSTKKCNSPILEQYVLGQKIGIRGTPAIILENGRIIPGYQTANELINGALQAASSKTVAK